MLSAAAASLALNSGPFASRLRAGDELEEIYTWFTSDDLRMGPRLEARGFVRFYGPGGHVLTADLANIPEPVPVPRGATNSVTWPLMPTCTGASSRTAPAFAPSDLTVPMYERVRRTWPYRPELDRIVRTSDGEIAACCIAWLDETNGAVFWNPSRLTPRTRIAASGGWWWATRCEPSARRGRRVAQVGTSGPAARAAYTAAGFQPWKREITFFANE